MIILSTHITSKSIKNRVYDNYFYIEAQKQDKQNYIIEFLEMLESRNFWNIYTINAKTNLDQQLKKGKIMSQLKNYYDVLQVSPTASSFEIEQAYEKLSTFWHPDKHKEKRLVAERKFQQIAEAYDCLSNRNSRIHYDQLLHQQYSINDANSTFQRFFDQHGIQDQSEKKFFDSHYPKKQKTYYDVLQVSRNASLQDIKKAYRKLALKYHPKNNSNSEQANKKFVEVNEAYNAISTEMKRQSYDNFLFGEIEPVRAHNMFENFFGDRFFNFSTEEQFFKPLIKKKWSRNLDNLMEDEDSWKNIDNGETVKTNTVYQNNNGVESKKTVTTKKKIDNGVAKTITTEQYEFPNGAKEVRKIMDDGKGRVDTKVYNLKKGQNLPIEN